MSKKQTAVEWLKQKIKEQGVTHYFTINELIRKAIQMEREQIEEAFSHGLAEEYYDSGLTKSEYYTQTYGECTQQ